LTSDLTASCFASGEFTFFTLCIVSAPAVIVFLDYRTPQASAISSPKSQAELGRRSFDLVTSREVGFIADSARLV